MLKKRNAVIVGLTSITLFTGCLAFIHNADNQNKVLAESLNQNFSPQLSEVVAPTSLGTVKASPPVPVTNNTAIMPATAPVPVPAPTPTPTPEQPLEQPVVATPDVKNNSSQIPTQFVKVVPPTTPKTTTTKTRAS